MSVSATETICLFYELMVGHLTGMTANTLAVDPPLILFVRGADRSGGFMYQASDLNLTAQLADITDETAGTRNTGWHTFAEALRADGFTVSQIDEPLEDGAPATGQSTGSPIAFDAMDLSVYDVIVMGSNNAVYDLSLIHISEPTRPY